MDIQLDQVMHMAFYGLGVGGVYYAIKYNYNQVAALLALVILAAFFVNPIRNTQEGIISIENTMTIDMPDRVIVEDMSFEDYQETEHLKLRTKSEELFNEKSSD